MVGVRQGAASPPGFCPSRSRPDSSRVSLGRREANRARDTGPSEAMWTVHAVPLPVVGLGLVVRRALVDECANGGRCSLERDWHGE
jgi:hypothetical protein